MNLIEGIQAELDRVRELIRVYKTLGPAASFAIMMHEQAILLAEKAIADQDTVAMVRAFKTLQGCE